MTQGWMVRAGRGGKYVDEFEQNNYVAVGWNKLGPLNRFSDSDSVKQAYLAIYGNDKPGKTANAIGMIRRFGQSINKGDWVVTYNPKRRVYLLGRDKGQFVFIDRDDEGYRQTRRVEWVGEVSRDALSQSSRNSLSSTLTLFAIKSDVIEDLIKSL